MAVATAFAGPIRARPTAVGHEILWTRLPGGGAPTWVARASRGWPKMSPTDKTRLVENGSKLPSSRSTGFGEFF